MQNKKALSFIFITLVIDCIGLGIIVPVTPSLIKELIGGDINTAAIYGGWLAFSYAIMQFICSPILGGLSDRFGRRPIILLSLLGLGIDYLFLSVAPNIFWLFIGRIIAGIGGASFTSATAYITDVTTPEKRAQGFGMIGAAFGIGFILGPLLGSLLSTFGLRAPFVGAAILSLLNFVYGYFVLPESLALENRRKFDWKRANPVGSLLHLKKHHPSIIKIIIAIFLVYLAGNAMPSIWTYFTIYQFGWNEQWVGYSLAFVGLCVGIVQGGLIRIIVPKIGQKNAAFIGFFLYFIGFNLFAFANQSWMMFAFIIPYALAGITVPSLQGIVTSQIEANAQGELQGTITSLISLTSILGPLLMTNLFYHFTKDTTAIHFPGAPFFAGGLLTIVAIIIVLPTLRKK